jgi:hypothetical protein
MRGMMLAMMVLGARVCVPVIEPDDASVPHEDAAGPARQPCAYDSQCAGLDGPEVCYARQCVPWYACREGVECAAGTCMAYDERPCPPGERNCVCIE